MKKTNIYNIFKAYKKQFKLESIRSQWYSDSNYSLLLFEEIRLTKLKEFFIFSVLLVKKKCKFILESIFCLSYKKKK